TRFSRDWSSDVCSSDLRITMTNINDEQPMNLYYQIDYTLTDVPDDAAYFHAQFRRTKVNETSDYTIIDGIKGEGHYVGVYMAWRSEERRVGKECREGLW